MHKLPSSLFVLIAAGAIGTTAFAAAPQLAPAVALSALTAAGRSDGTITLIAGMKGGMMGGGMANGGMMGGGMANGGMMGVTGAPNGASGYGSPPAYGNAPVSAGYAQSYDGSGRSAEATHSTKIYHCVTRHGQCAEDSSLGPLQRGASCGCLLGGPGKIQ